MACLRARVFSRCCSNVASSASMFVSISADGGLLDHRARKPDLIGCVLCLPDLKGSATSTKAQGLLSCAGPLLTPVRYARLVWWSWR